MNDSLTIRFQEKVLPIDLNVFVRSWLLRKKVFRLGVFFLLGIVLSSGLVASSFGASYDLPLLLIGYLLFLFSIAWLAFRLKLIHLHKKIPKHFLSFTLTQDSISIDQGEAFPWRLFDEYHELDDTFYLLTKEEALLIVPTRSLNVADRFKIRAILTDQVEEAPPISKRAPLFVTSIVVTALGLYLLVRIFTV